MKSLVKFFALFGLILKPSECLFLSFRSLSFLKFYLYLFLSFFLFIQIFLSPFFKYLIQNTRKKCQKLPPSLKCKAIQNKSEQKNIFCWTCLSILPVIYQFNHKHTFTQTSFLLIFANNFLLFSLFNTSRHNFVEKFSLSLIKSQNGKISF